MDFSALLTTEGLLALLTLASLEIVLGIDNIVFIAILTGRLPEEKRGAARQVGLLAALVMRLLLLFMISWIMKLKDPLFHVAEHGVSGKDLILIIGGLFLIAKATYEIHHKVEAAGAGQEAQRKIASFAAVIVQIMLIDIVFSLDSVITAVGMAKDLSVMVVAVVLAVIVMLVFAGPISSFIEKHPTFKMLALAFLLLIGVVLVADGLHHHVPKGYIYFAMGFSLLVEVLNMWTVRRSPPAAAHTGH
ncbi:MAG: TerC family protein [Phycisphaerae bacterium]|nr:TerC family protein [Phycisphaerae bacterium]